MLQGFCKILYQQNNLDEKLVVVVASQEDNWESSNMGRVTCNDLEIDEVSGIIDFGLELESDVEKAYCSPYSSSISLVTLIYLSWLHKCLKLHSGGVHSPIYNGAIYSFL